MTEERIKELAKRLLLDIHDDCFLTFLESTVSDKEFDKAIEMAVVLIRTVAAEAREEGIEEFYAHLIKIHPASLEQIANLMNELLEKKNV